MPIDDFLPCLEITSSLFTKLWNLCTTGCKDCENAGVLKGTIDNSQTKLAISYNDLLYGQKGGIIGESNDLLESKFFLNKSKNPNCFQTANSLQISKTQMQEMCEELKSSISKFKHSKIIHEGEAEEIARYITVQCNSPSKKGDIIGKKVIQLFEEKVQLPSITDFIKICFIIAADQITHKLLYKILAIVPDLTISMYPIKGFAVVSTPMSVKLLHKDQPSGEPKRMGRSIFQTGFLTLDQDGRIVPLHASDPKVKVYSLVGIWVTGVPTENITSNLQMQEEEQINDSHDPKAKLKKFAEKQDKKAKVLKHSLVMSAILRFLFSEDIKLRISPLRKQKENPCFLLLHFQGSPNLPQFLEFQVKKTEKTADYFWQLFESADSVPREPKNAFKQVQVKIMSNKESTANYLQKYNINGIKDPRTYSIYKLSNIISSLQEKQTQRAFIKKTLDNDKENIEPNIGNKTRNAKINTQTGPLEERQIQISKGLKLRIVNDQVNNSKKEDSTMKKDGTLSQTNLKIIRLGSASRNTLKTEKENSNIARINEDQVKLNDAASGRKNAKINQEKASSRNNSMNSSINSSGLSSSKLVNKVRPRIRGNSEFEQSSVLERFPSYSGNMSLIRNPEYSTLRFNNNNNNNKRESRKDILLEQQKTIQILQNQMIIMQNQINQMQRKQNCSSLGQLNCSQTNALNVSADVGCRSRCNLPKYQPLNLSQAIISNGDISQEFPFMLDESKIERINEPLSPTFPASGENRFQTQQQLNHPKLLMNIISKKPKEEPDISNSEINEIINAGSADERIPSESLIVQADSRDILSSIKETNESLNSIDEEAIKKKAQIQKQV